MANGEDFTGAKKTLKTIYKIGSKVLFGFLLLVALFLLYVGISYKLYKAKGDKFKPKFTLYTIVSPSMYPKIKVGDIIIDVRVDKPTDIKKGDTITFLSTSSYSKGLTVTHEVIDIIVDENGNYQYQTKGVNNMSPDAAYATYENVLGKYVFKIPKFGYVQNYLSHGKGWILLIIIPTLAIIIKDIIKLVKLAKIQEKASNMSNETYERKMTTQMNEETRQESIQKRLDE